MMDAIKTALGTTDVKISDWIYLKNNFGVKLITENKSGDNWLLFDGVEYEVRELSDIADCDIDVIDAVGTYLEWDEDDFATVLCPSGMFVEPEPGYEFTAVAGPDLGQVYAWILPSSERIVISAKTNAETWNYLIDQAEFGPDDMAEYVIADDLDEIGRADITGEIPDPPDSKDDPCCIISETLTTDGYSQFRWVYPDDQWDCPMEFANTAEAEEYIAGPTYLNSGEMSKKYHIVSA